MRSWENSCSEELVVPITGIKKYRQTYTLKKNWNDCAYLKSICIYLTHKKTEPFGPLKESPLTVMKSIPNNQYDVDQHDGRTLKISFKKHGKKSKKLLTTFRFEREDDESETSYTERDIKEFTDTEINPENDWYMTFTSFLEKAKRYLLSSFFSPQEKVEAPIPLNHLKRKMNSLYHSA